LAEEHDRGVQCKNARLLAALSDRLQVWQAGNGEPPLAPPGKRLDPFGRALVSSAGESSLTESVEVFMSGIDSDDIVVVFCGGILICDPFLVVVRGGAEVSHHLLVRIPYTL